MDIIALERRVRSFYTDSLVSAFSAFRILFLIFTIENDRAWGPVDQLGYNDPKWLALMLSGHI